MKTSIHFFLSSLTQFSKRTSRCVLVNNKMYTQRRLTQLYIYLSLATGFCLTDHLQALFYILKAYKIGKKRTRHY